jgi:hypothetical protein
MNRILFVILLLFVCSMAAAQDSTATHSLKYKIIDQFGPPFFCDSDKWPVARPEQPRAQEWFSRVDLADPEFKIISSRLKLEKPADHLTQDEILSLYQEHKKLQAIPIDNAGGALSFSIRTGKVGEQGEAISGTISASGDITIQKRETVWNVCPKCLAAGTLIDTPGGEVAVQDLRPGMPVWTSDGKGTRMAGVVEQVVRLAVPSDHDVIRIQLENGRVLSMSAEHPLPDGRTAGRLAAGETISALRISSVERVHYAGEYTYDLLPSGPTGFYWAEGVLVATTVAR